MQVSQADVFAALGEATMESRYLRQQVAQTLRDMREAGEHHKKRIAELEAKLAAAIPAETTISEPTATGAAGQ